MLWIVDKLMIGFLYTNVLAPKLTIGDVSLTKLLVGLSLYFYGVYALATRKSMFSRRTATYILVSLTMGLGLSLISLFKGNAFENISEFLTPLLILLTIPLMSCLIGKHGTDRYLLNLEMAISLLAAYVIGVYVVCGPLGMREASLVITEVSEYTSISFPDGTVKVSVVTGGFFASALLIATYFLSKGGALLHFLILILVGSAIYIGHTIGIWLASGASLLAYIVLFGSSKARAAVVLLVLVVASVGGASLIESETIATPEQILQSKEASFTQKQLQTDEGLALFYESPLLGKGLGHLFYDSAIPHLSKSSDIHLEVSYITLLAATGLLGGTLYCFIYGFYPLLAIRALRVTPVMAPLVLAHASILIAASANPYIWSGGMGLLFVVFIAGVLEAVRSSGAVEPGELRAA